MLEDGLIQIAGVHDEAEARLMQECGVRYVGFPLRLPVHQPDLTERAAARIIRGLAPWTHAVLITYLADAEQIAALCRFLGVRIVQLHGDIARRELERLRTHDPALTIVKSLVVGRPDADATTPILHDLSAVVDAYILDTFDPQTGASGATGKTHDWRISRRLVQRSPRPVILAGGLTPENVRRAILEVRPAGVDSHTGVEDASGRKSREKVEQFVAEAQAAFRLLGRDCTRSQH
jgi:phosphoribosylanthranilate isomerase